MMHDQTPISTGPRQGDRVDATLSRRAQQSLDGSALVWEDGRGVWSLSLADAPPVALGASFQEAKPALDVLIASEHARIDRALTTGFATLRAVMEGEGARHLEVRLRLLNRGTAGPDAQKPESIGELTRAVQRWERLVREHRLDSNAEAAVRDLAARTRSVLRRYSR